MAVVTVDFDGTLYKGNSFNAMFKLAKKEFTVKEWVVVFTGLMKAAVLGLFKGKNEFRKQFFMAFAKSFKGKTKEEMNSFFDKLVDIGKVDINKELVSKIREHQQNGHEVIILSGALQPFLHAFIKEVELDVPVISSQILYDENGVCTGKVTEFVNGEEKVKKVKDWLSKTAKGENDSRKKRDIWAYADSESDLPLFQYATYPIVVNPDKEMKLVAEKNDWPVF